MHPGSFLREFACVLADVFDPLFVRHAFVMCEGTKDPDLRTPRDDEVTFGPSVSKEIRGVHS